MSDTKERLALASATITAFLGGETDHPLAKVARDIDLCAARAEPEQREQDPRIDALGSSAILTDTQLRITFAPERPEARVVALRKDARCDQITRLETMTQRGKVHLQLKRGFAAERHLVLDPAEVALLYEMLDMFIQELPRVDDKTVK